MSPAPIISISLSTLRANADRIRRRLGGCKNCGSNADQLLIDVEDYSLVARCLQCGRNAMPPNIVAYGVAN